MKRKILTVLLLVSIVTLLSVITLQSKKSLIDTLDLQFNQAIDEELEIEIETAISKGIANLASIQYPFGGWPGYFEQMVACTGLTLTKLQDRAYEFGFDSPFNPEYEYSENVIKGWNFIFLKDSSNLPYFIKTQSLNPQDHREGASGTIDNPDLDADGIGIYFGIEPPPPGDRPPYYVYSTGIMLMALEASGTPNRPNDGEFDFNGDGVIDTFHEIAQNAVEWLAMAQGDLESSEGGWGYDSLDNQHEWTDNSNSGYATLGLAAAEGFGCIIPDWVRTELNVWIDAIQNDENGGSSYGPYGGAENQLKTGNLIFEMTFYGDDPNTPRFQAALDYIEQHWQSDDSYVRWQGDVDIDDDGDGLIDEDWLDDKDNDGDGFYNEDPGCRSHQAMYCLMKGFEYSGIELIDLDGDGTAEYDWYQEFAEVLLDNQLEDGSWPYVVWDNFSPPTLSIVWALLTLEKSIPSPPVIYMDIDIKPDSDPNSINMGDTGLLPVAILGKTYFDVITVDIETITIGGVYITSRGSPKHPKLAYSFEDVNGDGYTDLIILFDVQQLVLNNILDSDTIALIIEGNLLDQYGGTPLYGSDSVRVVPP